MKPASNFVRMFPEGGIGIKYESRRRAEGGEGRPGSDRRAVQILDGDHFICILIITTTYKNYFNEYIGILKKKKKKPLKNKFKQ